MGGCKSDHKRHERVVLFETGSIHVVPDTYAARLLKHGLGMKLEDFQTLKQKGGTMKVKILRNGKVCDMPDQNAQGYIRTGQAVAVDSVGKTLEAPVKDKMVRKAPRVKSADADGKLFVCPDCGKVYKTERGLANHKCK